MGKRIAVTVGQFVFASKTDVAVHIRQIINRTENEQPLIGQDAEFVGHLFSRHPEYEERVKGRTIRHFTVSTTIHGSRCFYAVYSDGTMEDFSTKKLIHCWSDTDGDLDGHQQH